jgi:ABC-2 type transport system ATP-binding protein
MLQLKNVTKTFGEMIAVDNLNLDIPDGELFGFLGPNGAGKTTTIKMMTGLYAPTKGYILVNGYDIQKDPLKAKLNTGYIPDQPFVYEKLTGREYLFFCAGLYKIGHTAAKHKIESLLAQYEIGSWIDQRCENYSQGMRQRLVIASSLLSDPKVIIVDEPMVGLDPRSAHIVKEELKKKSKEGVTIFMSTHSLNVAEELCDRIGIVKEGRLIYLDTPQHLRSAENGADGKFESLFMELTK